MPALAAAAAVIMNGTSSQKSKKKFQAALSQKGPQAAAESANARQKKTAGKANRRRAARDDRCLGGSSGSTINATTIAEAEEVSAAFMNHRRLGSASADLALDKLSPECCEWVLKLSPVLNMFDYDCQDIVDLVKQCNYDEVRIQAAVESVFESRSGHEQGEWRVGRRRSHKVGAQSMKAIVPAAGSQQSTSSRLRLPPDSRESVVNPVRRRSRGKQSARAKPEEQAGSSGSVLQNQRAQNDVLGGTRLSNSDAPALHKSCPAQQQSIAATAGVRGSASKQQPQTSNAAIWPLEMKNMHQPLESVAVVGRDEPSTEVGSPVAKISWATIAAQKPAPQTSTTLSLQNMKSDAASRDSVSSVTPDRNLDVSTVEVSPELRPLAGTPNVERRCSLTSSESPFELDSQKSYGTPNEEREEHIVYAHGTVDAEWPSLETSKLNGSKKHTRRNSTGKLCSAQSVCEDKQPEQEPKEVLMAQETTVERKDVVLPQGVAALPNAGAPGHDFVFGFFTQGQIGQSSAVRRHDRLSRPFSFGVPMVYNYQTVAPVVCGNAIPSVAPVSNLTRNAGQFEVSAPGFGAGGPPGLFASSPPRNASFSQNISAAVVSSANHEQSAKNLPCCRGEPTYAEKARGLPSNRGASRPACDPGSTSSTMVDTEDQKAASPKIEDDGKANIGGANGPISRARKPESQIERSSATFNGTELTQQGYPDAHRCALNDASGASRLPSRLPASSVLSEGYEAGDAVVASGSYPQRSYVPKQPGYPQESSSCGAVHPVAVRASPLPPNDLGQGRRQQHIQYQTQALPNTVPAELKGQHHELASVPIQPPPPPPVATTHHYPAAPPQGYVYHDGNMNGSAHSNHGARGPAPGPCAGTGHPIMGGTFELRNMQQPDMYESHPSVYSAHQHLHHTQQQPSYAAYHPNSQPVPARSTSATSNTTARYHGLFQHNYTFASPTPRLPEFYPVPHPEAAPALHHTTSMDEQQRATYMSAEQQPSALQHLDSNSKQPDLRQPTVASSMTTTTTTPAPHSSAAAYSNDVNMASTGELGSSGSPVPHTLPHYDRYCLTRVPTTGLSLYGGNHALHYNANTASSVVHHQQPLVSVAVPSSSTSTMSVAHPRPSQHTMSSGELHNTTGVGEQNTVSSENLNGRQPWRSLENGGALQMYDSAARLQQQPQAQGPFRLDSYDAQQQHLLGLTSTSFNPASVRYDAQTSLILMDNSGSNTTAATAAPPALSRNYIASFAAPSYYYDAATHTTSAATHSNVSGASSHFIGLVSQRHTGQLDPRITSAQAYGGVAAMYSGNYQSSGVSSGAGNPSPSGPTRYQS